MASNFINVITNIEEIFSTGFNYKDCLFIADTANLNTGVGEAFNGTVQHITFSSGDDAKKAVVSGSDVDLFIDGFFSNSKQTDISRLTIVKLGATYVGQIAPNTVDNYYKDTLVNLIKNKETNSLFYLVAVDTTDINELTNIMKYVSDNGTEIKKQLILSQYVPTGIGVQDIITSVPTSAILSGTKYLIGVGATGALLGQDNKLATYHSVNGWSFATPKEGDVFFLTYSTDPIYSGATETYAQNTYLKYNTAYTSSVAGFLFEPYEYSFDLNTLYLSKQVIDNSQEERVVVVTEYIQSQSITGAIAGYVLSSFLNGEIYFKELVGVQPYDYSGVQDVVLRSANTIWYADDAITNNTVGSSQGALKNILSTRQVDYMAVKVLEKLTNFRKNSLTALTYDAVGRSMVTNLVLDGLESANTDGQFIGKLENPVKSYKELFGTSYKDEGLNTPYYVYVSKITEFDNATTQNMQIVIGVPLKFGVKQIQIFFNIKQGQ